MKICFATNNKNKIKEIQAVLGDGFEIFSMADIGCTEDIPEPYPTLEENSLEKANYIWEKYQINCFADDSGLEVETLNNAPGAFSARYAGEQRNDDDNIEFLLKNLSAANNRKARFRTCITLIVDGKVNQFEGIVTGQIIQEKRGNNGFGYDPVFVPDGYQKTFAEMELSEKNSISHRAKAFQKLINFLK